MGKLFQVTKNAYIVCDWVNTRSGFRHDARLFVKGTEVDKAKVNYLNRTWEKWEYDSVIQKLLDQTDSLTKRQKTYFWNRRNEYEKSKYQSLKKVV